MLFKADLHIHSCLSPCASLEMSPSAIAGKAKRCGLDLVALTDHNSALNAPAFAEACRREGVVALFGIEVCSIEEVHSLCLFASPEAALGMGAFLYPYLPRIINNVERFGDQVYVDADENILGEVELYLGSAVQLSFEDVEREAHRRGGLFVPAHIDRPMFGVLNQLGFLPEGEFDALELSRHAAAGFEPIRNLPFITGSDSHYLDSLGDVYTEIDAASLDFKSIKEALAKGLCRIIRSK